MTQLILYACPIGAFAEQVEAYFELAQQRCGKNKAHAYMPHCTLTNFFEDERSAIANHITVLGDTLATHRQYIPSSPIHIGELLLKKKWHGFALQADWLNAVVKGFVASVNASRQEEIGVQDWLHLSLAYGFPLAQGEALKELATEMINPDAAVSWALRLYEKTGEGKWICHYEARLD